MLVGDNAAPIQSRLLAETRGGVEEELGVGDRVSPVDARQVSEVVAALLALTTDAEDELEGGVVEGKRNAADLLRLGLEIVLGLHDELLEVRRRKLVALLLVKVHVRDLHLGLEVVRGEAETRARVTDRDVRARDDNELLKTLKLDIELNAVVSERSKRESRTRREGEVEGKWDVQITLLARVTHELRSCVAATCELGQATATLASQLLPAEQEGTPQLIHLLTTDDQLRLVDQEVTRVVAVVAPRVTELRADRVGAVGVTLHAARELTTRTVLLAAPDVLGLLERLRLLIGGHVVVVHGEVLEESGLVHLGTRVARGTTVHEDWELTTRGDARAVLSLGVARDKTGKGDVNIEEINHISNAVQEDLALLAKVRACVEGLSERLNREAGVTLPGRAEEGGLRVSSDALVDEPLCKNIVVRSRHFGMCGVCVLLYSTTKKKLGRRAHQIEHTTGPTTNPPLKV